MPTISNSGGAIITGFLSLSLSPPSRSVLFSGFEILIRVCVCQKTFPMNNGEVCGGERVSCDYSLPKGNWKSYATSQLSQKIFQTANILQHYFLLCAKSFLVWLLPDWKSSNSCQFSFLWNLKLPASCFLLHISSQRNHTLLSPLTIYSRPSYLLTTSGTIND